MNEMSRNLRSSRRFAGQDIAHRALLSRTNNDKR